MSTREEISARVKDVRTGLALTQQEFGALIGYSAGYIKDIERARSAPSLKLLTRLRDRCHINPDWIQTGSGRKRLHYRDDELDFGEGGSYIPTAEELELAIDRPDAFTRDHITRIANSTDASAKSEVADLHIAARTSEDGQSVEDEGSAVATDYVSVPVFDIRVSAGDGAVADSARVVDRLTLPRTFFARRGVQSDDCGVAVVSGASMERALRDGDLVVFSRRVDRIKSDVCYVLRIYDDLVVKYLRQLPSGDVEVYAENSELFRPYVISRADFETDQVEIVGRVVGAIVSWP